MAVTANTYPGFDLAALQAKINTTHTFKAMLLSSYTFSNAHATMTAVKAAGTESSGTGYTAGGATLTTVTATVSGWVVMFDCDDVTWATSTVSASHAVFYDANGGTDATNIPMAHWDFGGTVSTSAGTFTLTISASGVKTITGS